MSDKQNLGKEVVTGFHQPTDCVSWPVLLGSNHPSVLDPDGGRQIPLATLANIRIYLLLITVREKYGPIEWQDIRMESTRLFSQV